MIIAIIDKDIDQTTNLTVPDMGDENDSLVDKIEHYCNYLQDGRLGQTHLIFLREEVDLEPLVEGGLIDLYYNVNQRAVELWECEGRTYVLCRLARMLYCILHPVGNGGAFPLTGQINWVSRDTLEFMPQAITIINAQNRHPEMDNHYHEGILRKTLECAETFMVPNEFGNYFLPSKLDEAIQHMPWEACYCGDDFMYVDHVDSTGRTLTAVRFVPTLGCVVDVIEKEKEEPLGGFVMKYMKLSYDYTLVHRGITYTASHMKHDITAAYQEDLHHFRAEIGQLLDKVLTPLE